MDLNSDKARLEQLVANPGDVRVEQVPAHLRSRLDRWKWGKMGWTSPANLIITATWRKAFYPKFDCCKIWARDDLNKAIPNSYSIRTADETVTVPVFSKYDLCTGFCSSNSGMQGTRAIEKSRGIGRINRDLNLGQRTIFDAQLFAEILNDINDLEQPTALETLKYLIAIAYASKQQRNANDTVLQTSPPRINLLEFSSIAKDPEFAKCVTAACLDALYCDLGFQIEGVEAFKTASDGNAEKAGDLSITRNGKEIVAVEVKDRTRSLDWNNVNGARLIIRKFPQLEGFFFVLESRSAAHEPIIAEMAAETSAESAAPIPVSFISLPDLIGLAAPIKGYDYLIEQTAHYVTVAPSIKPATKTLWASQP